MSNPYRLQNRSDGVTIRQGSSYVTLRRDEMKALIRDLSQRLDDPNNRVEEKTTSDRR